MVKTGTALAEKKQKFRRCCIWLSSSAFRELDVGGWDKHEKFWIVLKVNCVKGSRLLA